MTIPEAFQLALAQHQGGRLAEAETLYRQILAVQPQHADALHLLGVIAHQVGRHEHAVDLISQAIALAPENAAAHSNLGAALKKQGHPDEAVAAYRRALQLDPGSAKTHYDLGIALREQGHIEEAIAAYRRAVELAPELAEVHNNLGLVLKDQGKDDEAIAAYRRAIQIKPDFAEAHNNLGVALNEQGKPEEAIAECHRAIELQPTFPEALNNLGNALMSVGRFDEAVAAFHRALELQPELAGAHSNLGNALKEQGRIWEALDAYRHALQIQPQDPSVQSNLLLGLHYLPDGDAEFIFREHCRWGEIHAAPLAKRVVRHANDPNPARRLRVGYLSRDFREHSVAFFFENLLASHHREHVEVICYSDCTGADAVTLRMRKHAAEWRTITGLADAQVADLIREDGIDLLVDLAGHTDRNRLLVLARRPAPVQVTCLGYPDTTGMNAVDYRLTDAHADPPGATERFHIEQLVRLPDCAWCFRPSDDAPPVSTLPVLHSGHITFGCFNTRPKITEEMFAIWAEILLRAPGSRLLLKNLGFRDPSVQMRARALLEKAGVAPARVELIGRVSDFAEHLTCYGRVDIALDTFPYHGTTTTCEALWMGVPVITLAGKTHASRVGVSLLENLALPELIAGQPVDYIGTAAELAADISRLAALRATLRERMASSPLMDGPRYARNVEHAFREMWRAWCAKQTAPVS